MVKRLLIPRQLKVVKGELYAKEDINVGAQFLPWDGILTTCTELPADPVLQGDPRLYSGLVDNADLCNWVLFLPHSPLTAGATPAGFQTNILVSTGPTGEPIFTAIKPILAGDKILAVYQELHQALMFPALLILRCALFNKYVEKAVENLPVDLTNSQGLAGGGKMLLGGSLGSESPRSDGFDKISEDDRDSSPDCFRYSDEESTFNTSFSSLKSSPTPLSTHSAVTANPPHGSAAAAHHSHTIQNLLRTKSKRMLPCDTCGKVFDRPSLLERHVRIHTGERPYVCDFCQKGFSTSSSLNTHRRIHTGEKPHICKLCGKCFTASSNLYYHRMTHLKEKPHQCKCCPKSFSTPGDLRNHMKIHANNQFSIM